ncbi:MAG: hypothetical protein AB1898_04640 [Acidobacteriota bacterium]
MRRERTEGQGNLAGWSVRQTVIYTEADFERLSWHDCHIWAVELRAGNPDQDDWTSDLALDIDFIVDWICSPGGGGRFRVAPATLVFHGITDPQIDIDWGRSGFQTALHPVSIDDVERERIPNQKVYLDRPYYSWRIRLNWPKGGEIAFGAVGFTQTLRAEPILSETQCLSRQERKGLTG